MDERPEKICYHATESPFPISHVFQNFCQYWLCFWIDNIQRQRIDLNRPKTDLLLDHTVFGNSYWIQSQSGFGFVLCYAYQIFIFKWRQLRDNIFNGLVPGRSVIGLAFGSSNNKSFPGARPLNYNILQQKGSKFE